MIFDYESISWLNEISEVLNFLSKVLNNDVTTVVNFHAEWCEPCKLLAPKLEELVLPMPGVDLAIVDVEKCPELVQAFEVKAVPAVVAVRSGIVVDKFIGLVDAKNIDEFIKKIDPHTRPHAVEEEQRTPDVEKIWIFLSIILYSQIKIF